MLRTPSLLILSLSLLAGLPASGQSWGSLPGETLHVQAPAVPESVVFAGDTIRLDRPDFRERMDRELISFTYMHSNSLLMLKRSRRIFERVVPILKENGIPEDLKYLMAIESNLDPKAVSRTGATGLWQFTKVAALTYHLEVSAEVDERYHIEKETVAACNYLKDGLRKFGDWMTVAASYNAGQGGISRRLQDQKQQSALELWLPEETSRYMFRLLAAKLFFESPESFGFHVEETQLYPSFEVREEVKVSGPVASLVDFALQHGVTYAALKEANLWLRDDKLLNKSGKTYFIRIP